MMLKWIQINDKLIINASLIKSIGFLYSKIIIDQKEGFPLYADDSKDNREKLISFLKSDDNFLKLN